MKKFRFRLQRVMDVRRDMERQRKQELAQAQRVLTAEMDLLEELRARENTAARELNGKKTAARLDAVEMRLYYMYMEKLRRDIQLQQAQISRAHRHMEEKRERLLESTKEKKILEQLRDKEFRGYLRDTAREEQYSLDEIGTIAFARKRIENQ